MSSDTPRSVLQYVGGWKLGSTLGRGGFGHVRIAKHLGTGRTTACKILPAPDPRLPMTKDMVLDAMDAQKEEILLKVFSGLGIQGVVGIDLIRQEKEWKYLFLPLLPGCANSIRRPCPPAEIIPFFRQLLLSLAALHSIGVWHEDLKPDNILMTSDKMPVLTDFGLTTFSPNFKKMRGGGTLDYNSPEKVEGSRYDGAAADVYACGILLYKWLRNHHPFIRNKGDRKESDSVIENRIMKGEADFKLDRTPGSPGELIWKMIRADPKRRWTIPNILAHPFLNPPGLKPDSYTMPTPVYRPVSDPSPQVLYEITYLAYMAGQWYPCESDLVIRSRLADNYQRWEKNMYHALTSWKAKDPDANKDATAKPMMKALLRVLSETSISDKPLTSDPTPAQPQTHLQPTRSQLQPTRNQPTIVVTRPAEPVKPASPRKLDFPPVQHLNPNAQKNLSQLERLPTKTAAQVDKENVGRMLDFTARFATVEKVRAPVEPDMIVMRADRPNVMQDKTKDETNKRNEKLAETALATMVKVKQMRADIARKEEENEVIDLLSDSEAETMVEPVKRMQAKATKKKQVPTIQVNEEVIGEDGQVYLPAPLPKQRPAPRRSPRLQGIAPEHVALTFETKGRRTRLNV